MPSHKEYYLKAIITLHRDAQVGLGPVGISQLEEETDLKGIENVYITLGGDFLVGVIDGQFMAMGGFQMLSETTTELRRIRIRKELRGQGYGNPAFM